MIGIFDFGIGALTIARALRRELPGCDLLCVGDTRHIHYGALPAHRLRQLTNDGVQYLLHRGARIVVSAAHTAAAAVPAPASAEEPSPPVFDVVTSMIRYAFRISRRKSFALLTSERNIGRDVYTPLILQRDPAVRLFCRACPMLAPLVEEGWLRRPETAMIVKKCLPKDMALEVYEAGDGKEALEQFKKNKPDLTFLDLTMPVMDGIEALAAIKQLDSEAVVAVLTADIQQKTIDKVMSLGALMVLPKPVSVEALNEAFAKAGKNFTE